MLNNLLVIVSGPSGGGKGTIEDNLLSRNTQENKRVSTFTTRPRRQSERDSKQYNFTTQENYDRLFSQGRLMACSKVDGFSYRCT